MTMQRPKNTVDIDTLLAEKVPQTIIAVIDDIAGGLESVETELYVLVREGTLVAKAQMYIPLRKKLIIGGIVTALWFLVPEIQPFLLPLLSHLR